MQISCLICFEEHWYNYIIRSWAPQWNLDQFLAGGVGGQHRCNSLQSQRFERNTCHGHRVHSLSTGIIEAGRADVANGVMRLKFTRLEKSETASLCLPEQFQQCEHYTGPKKLDPPNLKQTVSPLSDVAHLATSFAKAKDRCCLAKTVQV